MSEGAVQWALKEVWLTSVGGAMFGLEGGRAGSA